MPPPGFTNIDLEDGQASHEKSQMMPPASSTATASVAPAAPPSFMARVRASLPKFRKPNHYTMALLAAIMGNVLEFYDFRYVLFGWAWIDRRGCVGEWGCLG
jgi:hypothetical protein